MTPISVSPSIVELRIEVALEPVVGRAVAVALDGLRLVGLLDVQEYAAPEHAVDALESAGCAGPPASRIWRGACGARPPTPWSPCRWSATATAGRNGSTAGCRSSARCAWWRCRKTVTATMVTWVSSRATATSPHHGRSNRPENSTDFIQFSPRGLQRSAKKYFETAPGVLTQVKSRNTSAESQRPLIAVPCGQGSTNFLIALCEALKNDRSRPHPHTGRGRPRLPQFQRRLSRRSCDGSRRIHGDADPRHRRTALSAVARGQALSRRYPHRRGARVGEACTSAQRAASLS